MAAKSGTITGSFAVSWLTPSIKWTVTGRTAAGAYTIKVEAIVTVTGSGVSTDRNATWTLVVDGSTLVNGETIRLVFDGSTPYPTGTTKVFIEKTVTLNANTDGSRSVAMSLTINTNGGASGNGSVTGTAELIPYFWWTGTRSGDTSNIAAGKPTTNLTATKWNAFNQMIKTYVNSSYSYSSAASGGTITKAMVKAAADQLGVSLQSDNVCRASYFIALRDALNTA